MIASLSRVFGFLATVIAGVGVVVGIPLAIGLSSLAESQLYGLAPHDPVTIAFATVLLSGVAALAGLIPARRASRIDPKRALRYE